MSLWAEVDDVSRTAGETAQPVSYTHLVIAGRIWKSKNDSMIAAIPNSKRTILPDVYKRQAELSDVVLDGGLDLLAELSGQLGHQLLHHGAHLLSLIHI